MEGKGSLNTEEFFGFEQEFVARDVWKAGLEDEELEGVDWSREGGKCRGCQGAFCDTESFRALLTTKSINDPPCYAFTFNKEAHSESPL